MLQQYENFKLSCVLAAKVGSYRTDCHNAIDKFSQLNINVQNVPMLPVFFFDYIYYGYNRDKKKTKITTGRKKVCMLECH